VGTLHREQIRRVTLQRRLWKDGLPQDVVAHRVLVQGSNVHRGGVDARLFRIIPREEARVDDDTTHYSGNAELNDCPVVTGSAAASRLPPVHPLSVIGILAFSPLGSGWLDEILFRRKEIIVGRENSSAHSLGGQVWKGCERLVL